MTGFAVIRHSETQGIGTAPADAMEYYLANGWVRVSEYRAAPADFHLPDFTALPVLEPVEDEEPDEDADPEPVAKAPAKTTTKESKR